MIAQDHDLSPEMMLPDLLHTHPEVRPVFDRYGLHGCGGKLGPVESIRFFARTHGVEELRLMDELKDAIAHPCEVAASAPDPADTIYRRYFLAGIVLILTAGATWGAYLLWQIGLGGAFRAVSIHAVNAHGHAQIYGWVGLFIMGFSLQAFPRIWHTTLWRPGVAILAFALMVAGLILRTIGMTFAEAGSHALAAAVVGGALELASVLLYAGVILKTFLGSEAPKTWKQNPYLGFAFAAVLYFIASTLLCLFHMWNTMTAANEEALFWFVATYQAPLRDLQIHGLALCMILGVSMRMFPGLFEMPEISAKRGWWAFILVNAGVLGEVVLFLAYRFSGNSAAAAFLMIPWLALTAGILMLALPWKLWRTIQVNDRSAKFIRAAYAWLAVSMILLLLLPLYQKISGIAFSHAYYGGIRHAITVGFISLMIMGFAAKVVPTLNGLDPRALTPLWGPFILVNAGCFLRVSLQTLTDWNPAFFSFVGVSGVLEVAGLAWWGAGLAQIMLGSPEALAEQTTAPKPLMIAADHKVADVLNWFPETLPVFESFGFTLLRNPLLRRTLARQVSLAQASSVRKVELATLLYALNSAIPETCSGKHACGHGHAH